MIKAVVIDDMLLARKALIKDIAETSPQVSIVGEAENVVEGAKLIKKTDPDLIFLDIHLSDGDGFDILEICHPVRGQVIFTTASDQHAIKAFRFSAIDYLLKPIDPTQLKQAIQKSLVNINEKQLDVSTFRINYQNPQKLVLHTAEVMKIVDIKDIIRLESMGNYTNFYFTDGTKLLITKTLKEYHELLIEHRFLRVHQSHLINLRLLSSYVKSEGGYLLMEDGSRIPVSVRKKPMVMEAIAAYASNK
jgi:two-component system LytT family response regulator